MNRVFLPLIGLVFAASASAEPLSLSAALEAARTNRDAYKAAQLRLESTLAARRGAGALPTTSLSIGFTTDIEVGGSDDDLVLTQPFDFFGRGSAARSMAEADVLRARAEMAQVDADIQFEVFSIFNDAVAAHKLAATAQQSAEIAQQLYDAIKALVDEGRLPGVQLTRVGIERDRAQLKALQQQGEKEAAVRRLSGATGIPVGEIDLSDFAVVPEIIEARRSDLLILDAEVKAAEAGLQSVNAIYRPEFEIQARRNAWQEPEARYGLRFQVTIPLFDHGRGRAEASAARILVDAARRRLSDAEKLAVADIEAARSELEFARVQIEGYAKVRQAAEHLVEVSRAGFTERAVTLIELLEATRALREVEEDEVQAELRLAQARAVFARASGHVLGAGK